MNPFSVQETNRVNKVQGYLNLSPRKADDKKRSSDGRYTHELARPESEMLLEVLISPTKRRQVEKSEEFDVRPRRLSFGLMDHDTNSDRAELKYIEGPAEHKYNSLGYVEDFDVPGPGERKKAVPVVKTVVRTLCPFLTQDERDLLDKLETRAPLNEEELAKVGIDYSKSVDEDAYQHLIPLYQKHIDDYENHHVEMARFITTHAFSMIQYAVTVDKAVLYPRETIQLPFSLLVSPANQGQIFVLLNSKGKDQRSFSGGFKVSKFGFDAANGMKYLLLSTDLASVSDTVRHGVMNEYRRMTDLPGPVENCLFPDACFEYPKKVKNKPWKVNLSTKVGFACRFITGGDLARSLAKKRVFSIEELCVIAHGILNGLVSLHKQGLLHLDVNPNNILLNFVKSKVVESLLIDWGNMQKIGDWTNFCTHLHYSPPEWLQELSAGASGRSHPNIFVEEWDQGRKYDAYSAGLTLYMLLEGVSTDNVPWLPTDQSSEYLRSHVFETIDTREEWHRQLPTNGPLQRIVKGLTDPDPRVRTSVERALEQLNAFTEMVF